MKAGVTVLGTWDPHDSSNHYGVLRYVVRFENVEEGMTVVKQVDEVTGLSTLVVIASKAS